MTRPVLLRFHIVLVASAIIFCFGFALFEFLRTHGESSRADVTLGVVFVLLGLGLAGYLRGVLRSGVEP